MERSAYSSSVQAEREAAAQANAHVRMLEQRVSAAEEDLEEHVVATGAARERATSAENDLEAQHVLTLAAQEQLATSEERYRCGHVSALCAWV